MEAQAKEVSAASTPSDVAANAEAKDTSFKETQISSLQAEISADEKQIETLKSQESQLQETVKNYQDQVTKTADIKFVINNLAVPIIDALESLKASASWMKHEDEGMSSEMYLKGE